MERVTGGEGGWVGGHEMRVLSVNMITRLEVGIVCILAIWLM